ncbi:FIG01035547: hypothetical protein [hydrothermal vent metagenome]|uniref:DUF3570 domain-containing protein n=1 Tax=hydrothermal vent metagenome TaxID=652676 RepID=A0A3B0YZR6_9ZZZZ
MEDKAGAVAVTKKQLIIAGSILAGTLPVLAAVLPEDRADAMYHSYDGGGVEINGPSILVRKSMSNNTSFSANYYIDSITSASIDVVTSASAYTEERTEYSVSGDYLHNKTTMSLAYTQSSENDFEAQSAHFSFSQDMFGDLTTVTMGYSRGWDEVGKTGDSNFSEEVDRQHYRVGLSQILTKSLITEFGWEIITDEGYLNNPYRTVRFIDPENLTQYKRELELYPNTRTSSALAARAMYYLPYRASIHASYRFYQDTWGINGHTYQIGYTHPYKKNWVFDIKYRQYNQNSADFYRDLFLREGELTFRARDKELSTFSTQTIGFAVSYEFAFSSLPFIKKSSINLVYDHIMFDYDNFRDLRVKNVNAGEEPLYGFSANVIQLYFSMWY